MTLREPGSLCRIRGPAHPSAPPEPHGYQGAAQSISRSGVTLTLTLAMHRTGGWGEQEPLCQSCAGAASWPPAPVRSHLQGGSDAERLQRWHPALCHHPARGTVPNLPATITTQIPSLSQSHARNRRAPSLQHNPGRGQGWEHIQPLGWTLGCTGTCTVMARLCASTRMHSSTARLRVSTGIHTRIHTRIVHTHTPPG